MTKDDWAVLLCQSWWVFIAPPPPHITLLVRAVMAELYYLLKSFYRPLNSQM